MSIDYQIDDRCIDIDVDGRNHFSDDIALALLLNNSVVFLNSHWWEKGWPKEAQESISVIVNCNDIFMWGAADGEDLPYHELEPLYRMYRKDPAWGAAVWCIQRRGCAPQRPVGEAIEKAGIWDLRSMGLSVNPDGFGSDWPKLSDADSDTFRTVSDRSPEKP